MGHSFFFFFNSLRVLTLRLGIYKFYIFTFITDSGILVSKIRTGVRHKTVFSEMNSTVKKSLFKRRACLTLSVNDSEGFIFQF